MAGAGPAQFHHLMAPGQIGSLKLRNRIVMPAMDQNVERPVG